MRWVVVVAMLVLTVVGAEALELGANYNEALADVYNALIVKSGVTWVRAYVNVPRNFLTHCGILPIFPATCPITGVLDGNIFQEPAHVSSDADVLAVAAVDKLINTKTVLVNGQPIKIILSLKHDFTYPYADEPPFGRIPDTDAERGFLIEAITKLLTTNGRGQHIDILVVGNEPMFEIQPNNLQTTADNYVKYLNELITALDALKQQKEWTFEIYVGALNHASVLGPAPPAPGANTIRQAVLDVLQSNPKRVAGIDLHEHVMSPSDALLDILAVKPYLQPGQRIISTEFSLVLLWFAHQKDPLGPWGERHGYPVDRNTGKQATFNDWINDLIRAAAAGSPVSAKLFMSYFEAQRWYPRHWFRTMLRIFEDQGLYVVTYGLEESPRYPPTANALPATALPWVLNGVYNGTLLGTSREGYYNTNPLVFPDFESAVRRLNRPKN